MTFTGNNYCKFCGDLIEPDTGYSDDVCGICFCEQLEEGTNGD